MASIVISVLVVIHYVKHVLMDMVKWEMGLVPNVDLFVYYVLKIREYAHNARLVNYWTLLENADNVPVIVFCAKQI